MHLSILGECIHYFDILKAYIKAKKASHTIKLLDLWLDLLSHLLIIE